MGMREETFGRKEVASWVCSDAPAFGRHEATLFGCLKCYVTDFSRAQLRPDRGRIGVFKGVGSWPHSQPTSEWSITGKARGAKSIHSQAQVA